MTPWRGWKRCHDLKTSGHELRLSITSTTQPSLFYAPRSPDKIKSGFPKPLATEDMIKQLSPAALNTIGNAGWLMADRVVRMGFGLVVGVWLARYLGPTQFGSLNFAMSFVALVGTVTTLGLDSIIIRNIVRDPSHSNEILGTAFVLRFWTSFFTCLLIVSARLLGADHDVNSVLVAILSLTLVFQSFDVIDSYFQSQVQSKFTVVAKNAAFLIGTAIRLLLIFLHKPLWWFALAYTLEIGLGAVGLTIAFRWSGGDFSIWSAHKARAVQLLKESWPILFSGMAIMIYMRIGVIMLEAMKGNQAVGIYATATKVSEVWYFVGTAIVSSVSPAIMRSIDNPKIYYSRIERLFCLMSLISLLVGSFIALSAPLIIRLLYTDAFAAAAPVLAVHVWASVFVFLGIAQSPWDLSQNLLKLSFYRTLAGAVANILLNFILIPKYSAMGAAIAVVVSYGISAVIGNVFSERTRPIFYMQLRSLYFIRLWTLRDR
jgi:PST family polysaccharide transporter